MNCQHMNIHTGGYPCESLSECVRKGKEFLKENNVLIPNYHFTVEKAVGKEYPYYLYTCNPFISQNLSPIINDGNESFKHYFLQLLGIRFILLTAKLSSFCPLPACTRQNLYL